MEAVIIKIGDYVYCGAQKESVAVIYDVYRRLDLTYGGEAIVVSRDGLGRKIYANENDIIDISNNEFYKQKQQEVIMASKLNRDAVRWFHFKIERNELYRIIKRIFLYKKQYNENDILKFANSRKSMIYKYYF